MDDFPPTDVIERLRVIEEDLLFAKGLSRTLADIRLAAIKSLVLLSKACNDRLTPQDPLPMRLMRDAVSLRPAPLQFLLYQLWEVHKGRPGQLFIHNPRAAKKATTGKDYHSVLRTQQQAEAAATLQCLKDSRMDLGPAGDAIADVLTAHGFRNPKRGSKRVFGGDRARLAQGMAQQTLVLSKGLQRDAQVRS